MGVPRRTTPTVPTVSRSHPEAQFNVLTAMPGDTEGFALVWITAPDVGPVIDDVREQPAVTDMEVVQRADTEATIQFGTTTPMLLIAAQRAGVPIEMPVRIRNGEATIDVSGAHDRLSTFGAQLEGMGLGFRIRYIRERSRPSQLLTETQQELLVTAVEMGYYDTPRECSLTELAEAVGIAKSTASETLHRAEGAVIKEFVGDLPPRFEPASDVTTP